MHQHIADAPFTVPTEVADRLIPQLLDTWACASVAGQTIARDRAAKELRALLLQPVVL